MHVLLYEYFTHEYTFYIFNTYVQLNNKLIKYFISETTFRYILYLIYY